MKSPVPRGEELLKQRYVTKSCSLQLGEGEGVLNSVDDRGRDLTPLDGDHTHWETVKAQQFDCAEAHFEGALKRDLDQNEVLWGK